MKLNNQKGIAALGLFALVVGALVVGLFVGSQNHKATRNTTELVAK